MGGAKANVYMALRTIPYPAFATSVSESLDSCLRLHSIILLPLAPQHCSVRHQNCANIMRLLELKHGGDGAPHLVEFPIKERIPPYAILSHTWGDVDQEVTFKDLAENTGENKEGYCKIRFCAAQAAHDKLQHFWIDTCCIDKTSSAELSEAITSMFRWYCNSKVCYVYMSDVSKDNSRGNDGSPKWKSEFRRSRWFQRGWTLQELIAPSSLWFFSCDGEKLGDKVTLKQEIYEITGIPARALEGAPLAEFSPADRWSWAKNRQTMRDEDQAYCLVGIFGISMTLQYGEGKEEAIKRLKRKIVKSLHALSTAADWNASRALTENGNIQITV